MALQKQIPTCVFFVFLLTLSICEATISTTVAEFTKGKAVYRTNQFQQNIFKHFKLVVTSLYHQFLKDTQDIDIELFNKT